MFFYTDYVHSKSQQLQAKDYNQILPQFDSSVREKV